MNKMIIAIDFDGVLAANEFPEIGRDLGSRYWLGCLKALGAEMVLWTCRSGASFKEMEAWIEEHGFGEMFAAVNAKAPNAPFDDDPRKIYATVYVDDRALGAPMKNDVRTEDPPYYDWDTAGPRLMKMAEAYRGKTDDR